LFSCAVMRDTDFNMIDSSRVARYNDDISMGKSELLYSSIKSSPPGNGLKRSSLISKSFVPGVLIKTENLNMLAILPHSSLMLAIWNE